MRVCQLLIIVVLFLSGIHGSLGQSISRCSNTETPCGTSAQRPVNPGVGFFWYNLTTNTFEVYNGTIWVALTTGEIDIAAFGAMCDGITDDASKINAAVTALRAMTIAGRGQYSAVLTGPHNGNGCVIRSTINLTQVGQNVPLSARTTTIDLPLILCFTPGQPCINAIGSKNMLWQNPNIYMDCTQPGYGVTANFPTVGIQVGRASGVAQSTHQRFDDPVIYGCATIANLYMYGNEISQIYNGDMISFSGTPVLMLDGLNHFGIVAGAPADTCTSFSDLFVLGGEYGSRQDFAAGPNIPIWMSCWGHRELRGAYACTACSNIGQATYPIMLYISAAQPNTGMDKLIVDMHLEVGTMLGSIIVAGQASGGLIQNLEFKESFLFRSDQGPILNLDSSNTWGTLFNVAGHVNSVAVTSVAVQNLDLAIGATSQNTNISTRVFDNSLAWNVYGKIVVPFSTMFSEPSGFSGTLCASDLTPACQTWNPSSAVNRNPEFTLDRVHVGGAYIPGTLPIVDGWYLNGVGAPGWVQSQRLSTLIPNGYSYRLNIAVQGVRVPAAGQVSTMRGMLEGPQTAALGFGGPQGSGNAFFSFDFCAKANNVGTYNAWVQDVPSTRSFLIEYTLNQANVWSCFHNVIPPDTSGGTFGIGYNTIGLFYGFTFGTGANFIGAALNGPINTFGTITPGAGYVCPAPPAGLPFQCEYFAVPLTGGTGAGATANIALNHNGGITNVGYVNPGTGYKSGDVLSASNLNLGGSGAGFQVVVGSISNTWQVGNFVGTPSAFSNTNFVNTLNATLDIAAVHFRVTQFNMPYQYRQLSQELQEAERWFNKSFAPAVAPANATGSQVGAVTGLAPHAFPGNISLGPIRYPTNMFTNNSVAGNVPTVTVYNPVGNNSNCYNITKAADSGVSTVINRGDGGFTIQCALVAADAADDEISAHWSAQSNF